MSQGTNNYHVCGTLVPNSISNVLDFFGGQNCYQFKTSPCITLLDTKMAPIHQTLQRQAVTKMDDVKAYFICCLPAGDRSKLKMLANQEPNVDCLDTAGHTPLMYAVMGKQTKVCIPYEQRYPDREYSCNPKNSQPETRCLHVMTHNWDKQQ